MNSITPARRRARLITGITAGALLVLAAPLAASAHVEVNPGTAPAGGTSRLTFSFHHGCDDSPTTALVIDIPAGVGNVMPVVEGGWNIQRTLGPNGVPTQVTFTAAQPIESGLSAAVSMDVLVDTAASGSSLTFPVVQKCVTGSTSWTQIPAAGADESTVEHPAPAISVGPAGAGDEDDNDSHSGNDMSMSTPEATAVSAASATADADPVARWLGTGGLIAGLAALAVVLVRRRKV
ncbi:MAG: YcnI family protein [Actinobacteria bacterium]|nr:YcnI family protein [Actinomycetota bacterium]